MPNLVRFWQRLGPLSAANFDFGPLVAWKWPIGFDFGKAGSRNYRWYPMGCSGGSQTVAISVQSKLRPNSAYEDH